MTDVQIVATLLGGLTGVGGWAAFLRAKAQNRLDTSTAKQAEASAEQTIVQTARELIEGVRVEMAALRRDTDAKVVDLNRQVAYLRGRLEAAESERDTLRKIEQVLRQENAHLRQRIDALEARIAELTDQLARAAQTTDVRVTVDPPA